MNDSLTSSPAAMAFRVLGAAHEVEARLEAALAGLGLSVAKFNVLSRLAEAGESLPLSQLADRCSCVRSNMTQLVDRLEADRLVERTADPTDRRSIRAVLTEAGRERHAEAARVLEETGRTMFAHLGEEDRADLARIVQLLAREP
jgi:DNA-binding MarR family transcriptional regulator